MTEEDKAIDRETAEGFGDAAGPPGDEAVEEPGQEDRVAALEAEVARLNQERAELVELARRLQADFDNFRRRTREETLELRRTAAADLIRNLLPVLDNLDRALAASDVGSDGEGLRQGVVLTRDQFFAALAAAGLEPVPAVGHGFDPALHEVLEKVEPEEAAGAGEAEFVVVEEFRRGYLLGGRLLRPSLVKVAPKVRRD